MQTEWPCRPVPGDGRRCLDQIYSDNLLLMHGWTLSVCWSLFVRRWTASQMTFFCLYLKEILACKKWCHHLPPFRRGFLICVPKKWGCRHPIKMIRCTHISPLACFYLSYGTYSHSLGTWHVCPCGCGWYGERCEDWQCAQHGFGLDFFFFK